MRFCFSFLPLPLLVMRVTAPLAPVQAGPSALLKHEFDVARIGAPRPGLRDEDVAGGRHRDVARVVQAGRDHLRPSPPTRRSPATAAASPATATTPSTLVTRTIPTLLARGHLDRPTVSDPGSRWEGPVREHAAMTAIESLDLPNPEFTPERAVGDGPRALGLRARSSPRSARRRTRTSARRRPTAAASCSRSPAPAGGARSSSARTRPCTTSRTRRPGSRCPSPCRGRRRERDRHGRRPRRAPGDLGRRARRSATGATAPPGPGTGSARSPRGARAGSRASSTPSWTGRCSGTRGARARSSTAIADAAPPADAPLVERAMAPFAAVLAGGRRAARCSRSTATSPTTTPSARPAPRPCPTG